MRPWPPGDGAVDRPTWWLVESLAGIQADLVTSALEWSERRRMRADDAMRARGMSPTTLLAAVSLRVWGTHL